MDTELVATDLRSSDTVATDDAAIDSVVTETAEVGANPARHPMVLRAATSFAPAETAETTGPTA